MNTYPKNAIGIGTQLNISIPDTKYKNDLIHPDVLYFDTAFAGHQWWMVATPYPNYDSSVENILLFYGDSEADGTPPLTWTFAAVVEDTPTTGYNSDGALWYDGTKLWILWRANGVPELNGNSDRCIFGVSTTDGLAFSTKKIFAYNNLDGYGDDEMCPIFSKIGDDLKMYATHYEFTPERKPYGLAIWGIQNNDLDNNVFAIEKYVGQDYYKDFNFWHFDILAYDGKYYCAVSTESASEVLFGISDDGYNFKFYKMPLLSSTVTGATYFYKPAILVKDDIFYLWHPVKGDDGINKLWMSSRNFTEMLDDLEKSISKII